MRIMSYLKFPLLRFVDNLRTVTQDVAVQNPEVLNVVFDNIRHLGFVFSNHHPKIPFRRQRPNSSLKWDIYTVCAIIFGLQFFFFHVVSL